MEGIDWDRGVGGVVEVVCCGGRKKRRIWEERRV